MDPCPHLTTKVIAATHGAMGGRVDHQIGACITELCESRGGGGGGCERVFKMVLA